jgi:predicted Zn-dependent protease with MMP-like domain
MAADQQLSEEVEACRRIMARAAILIRQATIQEALDEIPLTEHEQLAEQVLGNELGPRTLAEAGPEASRTTLIREDWLEIQRCVSAEQERFKKTCDRLTHGHPIYTKALDRYRRLNGLFLRIEEVMPNAG